MPELTRHGRPYRQLPDGRWLTLYPLLYGAGRLAVGGEHPDEDLAGYNDAYDWEDVEGARRAFEEWDGTGEPVGWYRHRPSHRRRPGGDPDLEEVRA